MFLHAIVLKEKFLADCGTGELNELETFAVTGVSTSCNTYRLLDSANYTYTPCNGFQSVSIYNISGAPQSVCAIEGSVSGGQFTFLSSCIE